LKHLNKKKIADYDRVTQLISKQEFYSVPTRERSASRFKHYSKHYTLQTWPYFN